MENTYPPWNKIVPDTMASQSDFFVFQPIISGLIIHRMIYQIVILQARNNFLFFKQNKPSTQATIFSSETWMNFDPAHQGESRPQNPPKKEYIVKSNS